MLQSEDFFYKMSISKVESKLISKFILDADIIKKCGILQVDSWFVEIISSTHDERELSCNLHIKNYDALILILKYLREGFERDPDPDLRTLIDTLDAYLLSVFCNCNVPYKEEFTGMIWCEGCHNRFWVGGA